MTHREVNSLCLASSLLSHQQVFVGQIECLDVASSSPVLSCPVIAFFLFFFSFFSVSNNNTSPVPAVIHTTSSVKQQLSALSMADAARIH